MIEFQRETVLRLAHFHAGTKITQRISPNAIISDIAC